MNKTRSRPQTANILQSKKQIKEDFKGSSLKDMVGKLNVESKNYLSEMQAIQSEGKDIYSERSGLRLSCVGPLIKGKADLSSA